MDLVATEIPVDALEAAERDLRQAMEYVSSEDGLGEAARYTRDAIAEAEGGDGSYQARLEDARDLVNMAVDAVEAYGEAVKAEYARGRIRATDETVVEVLRLVRAAVDHLGEWLEWATAELESLD